MRLASLALAVALALGAVWWWSSRGGEPEVPVPTAPRAERSAAGGTADLEPARTPEPGRREASAAPDAATAARADLTPESAPEGQAFLEVTVLASETEQPLAGATLAAVDAGGRPFPSDTPDRNAETDERGTARLTVPAGVAVKVAAWTERAAPWHETLAPLAVGERRAMTVRLVTQADVTLVGRAVDQETGAPVAGAPVRFQASYQTFASDGTRATRVQAESETETDADGWFTGEARSWRFLHGRIEAAGYGPTLFALARGHDTRETALVLPLRRGAVVRGRVVGHAAPETLVVRAEADALKMLFSEGQIFGSGDAAWRTPVDPDGRFELRDLAPDAPLALSLWSDGQSLWREGERVTLAPREEREVYWDLSTGATVRGTVTMLEDGRPLAEHALWLVPALAGDDLLWDVDGPVARATTDAAGRFTFQGIAPGAWRIGPAPARRRWDPPRAGEILPLAQPVTVPEGAAGTIDVQLTAQRGLFVEGTVLTPDGSPARNAQIVGQGKESAMWVVGEADDGTFRLGPVVPGTYELTASSSSEVCASSESVEAAAGATGVVLRLRPGGRIAGRMIDAGTREPRQGDVRYRREGEEGLTVTMAQGDGSFDLPALLPGRYHILGRSDGQAGELRDVVVAPGQVVRGLVLELAPAGTLRVLGAGGLGSGWFSIEADGLKLAYGELGLDGGATVSLPAGEYEVRLHGIDTAVGADDPRVYVVTLTSGEETPLDLGE